MALILHAVLDFIAEDMDPYAVVGRLLERLAPVSEPDALHRRLRPARLGSGRRRVPAAGHGTAALATCLD